MSGTQELVRALESLRALGPGAQREDLRDFLQSIHRIGRVEHDTDARKRAILAALVATSRDARELHVVAEAAGGLEQAADALLRTAWILRDRVLARLARPTAAT